MPGWQCGTSRVRTPSALGSSTTVAPGVPWPASTFCTVWLTGVLQGGTTTVCERLAGSTTARTLSGGGGADLAFSSSLGTTSAPIRTATISTPPTIHGTLFLRNTERS